MIAQVHTLAASRPSMTIFTTASAWMNNAAGDSVSAPCMTIVLSTLLPSQGFEDGDPFARLTFRPAVRPDEGRGHLGIGDHLIAAHDSLMNGAGGGADFGHLAKHQQRIVEPRRPAVADRQLDHRIDALAAVERAAL